jgi:hypothetical protein
MGKNWDSKKKENSENKHFSKENMETSKFMAC